MSETTPHNSQILSPNLKYQLQVLREAYIGRLGNKIDDIEAAWRLYLSLVEEVNPSEDHQVSLKEALALTHRLFHSLAGSGATFGLPEVSNSARVAEIILKEILHGERVLNEPDKFVVENAYKSLRLFANNDGLGEKAAAIADAEVAPQIHSRDIYLFSDQATGTHSLDDYALSDVIEGVPVWSPSVSAFGYCVKVFGDSRELARACETQIPAALIIDCEVTPACLLKKSEQLESTIKKLVDEKDVPLLWTSQNGDLMARLQSVRLGGAAFFTHPVDVDSLLVKLDDLTNTNAPEPYRVLIVDDEPTLAQLFSIVLRQAGMQVFEVVDPLDIMQPLAEFRPDLILMDVYMPNCYGTELASVIRQQEAYIGIPIVFLSVETDIAKQMDAMRRGGDDFLIKPVQPRHLISAVTARVSRARVLGNLMTRDSLTGLFNHTKTKEQLAIEVDRVKRLGHKICVAMIDIDHFKNVNDTYGHATGDRVLRSLSRLLVQRLRQTDIIGRYGGEEFAVIMNGANVEQGLKVLEDIRESFAQMVHFSDGHEFKVTFSAGLAEAPPHSAAENISETADRALYEAKRSGRNKIVVAEGLC
jgi:diguanylate cyclase (GGDEF)-like protein